MREAVGVTEPLRTNGASVAGSSPREACCPSAIAQALAVIPNDSTLRDERGILVHDWEYWNKTGMTIWASCAGSEEGRAAFHEWSAKAKAYNQANTEARWQHYFRSPPTKLGFGSLVWRAREAAPGWRYENPESAALVEAVGKLIAEMIRERDEPDDTDEAANDAFGAGSTTGAGASAAPTAIEPVDLWAKFDPPTLPRGLLPPLIEEFAFERSAVMGCDPTGLALGALAVCAASIPEDIQIQPKRNDIEWQESARIWIGLVGGVSEMKSPILDTVAARIRDIDYKMEHAYQEALDEWLALPKKAREKTPKPKHLRAKIMNTTVEAAADILKDSPDGVLLEQDELSGWFGSMDKYSGSRGAQADRAFWLQTFNGKPYTVDRIGRGSTYIPHLSVSILGFIQPEPIRKIADGGEDDGLMQRFIIGILCPAVKGGDVAPGQALFDYEDLVENLRKLRPPRAGNLYPPDVRDFR